MAARRPELASLFDAQLLMLDDPLRNVDAKIRYEMRLELPMVVRLDGTNAEEGRRILAEAAPPNLYVSPTMLEAAKRAVELAA